MPKIKTHSGAKKRFKMSKNGKPIRGHANKSHILNKKTTKRKRGLRQTVVADTTNVKQIKRLIPYKYFRSLHLKLEVSYHGSYYRRYHVSYEKK